MKKMEKGEKVQIEIIDISEQGQGIGRFEGLAVFVQDTVLGDKVTAELTKVKKNYAFGKLVSIDEPSQYRIEAEVPVEAAAGGCPLATTSYEGQLVLKQQQVRARLTRIAGLEEPKINPIVAMDNPYNYRNKATFPISTGGNRMKKGGILENTAKPAIGFYDSKSHKVTHCEDSIIHHPAAIAAAQATKDFMIEDNISAWHEEWGLGLMRHMIVKVGFDSKEVMVNYVINGKGIPNGEKLIEMLDAAIYQVGYELKSVNININKSDKANEIYGKETIPYAGGKIIHEKIGQLAFEVSPLSFYQVNPVMTEKLYAITKDYAGLTGKENVLDLYCGVGSIGLSMANKAKYVLGIESVKPAVLDANRNAVINNIVNARFICGKAEEELPKLLEGVGDEDLIRVAKNADVVVLDPPRAGCAPWLLGAVAKVKPSKIVYVSCDPATLARDIKLLTDEGYEFVEATPVDVFPWTLHTEVVSLLKLKA
ncbi:MAG: 23S rRNA (uracil(1939)-C(5))-methyltransferase RlmD [Anaerovoracaceae bacterium]